MDFILRHLNARSLVLFGGGLAFSALALRHGESTYGWYQSRRFAGERGAVAAAPDIAQDLEKRDSQRFLGLYRDVSAEISAAKARGRKVDGLQLAADKALAMNTPAGRAEAFDLLNRLRLSIPQPLDALRPAGDADVPADNLATPPAKAARRKRPQ